MIQYNLVLADSVENLSGWIILIFNSKIRYGIAAYITPIFEREDLKHKKLSSNASDLQILQNVMLRLILGLEQKDHINMQQVREKINLFSVNQIAIQPFTARSIIVVIVVVSAWSI